jgi:tetratricopeptide (TPR) repeat protein/predicted Ser/Thr protein kinase
MGIVPAAGVCSQRVRRDGRLARRIAPTASTPRSTTAKPAFAAIELDPTIPGQYAQAELAAGERVAGRYRIESLLGVGGMGVVYRAFDEELRIDVALKLLRPEFAARPESYERFRQELLLARQVSSPHVVRIHDLVSDGQRRLISMEYVPGRSLETWLDIDTALGEREALNVAREVALGLAAAHASGIVHRDLKPGNVLVRPDGHALISDFGVARSAAAERLTATGMMVGTPDYVSPEQARGESVGPRSDLYALGLMLYEMLVGHRAFSGGTAAESLARRQFAPPPSVRALKPEVAPWVDRLVMRLLAPNPNRRFRDAQAVVAAIDAQHVRWRPEWRPWMGRAATFGLLVVVAVAAWRMAGHGAVEAPPPRALVVLPFTATFDDDVPIALAYSNLVGGQLLDGERATADHRRTANALARLGYDGDAAVRHVDRVLAELGGLEALSGALERRDETLRITLRRHRDDETTEAATPWVSTDAMPAALGEALASLGLADRAGWRTPAPTDVRALAAFGHGLDRRNESEAMAAFAEAVTLEPQFVQAWLHYLKRARRLLPNAEVETLIGTLRSATRGLRGRDVERLRGLAALAEGDVERAVEDFSRLAVDDPDDHQTRLLYAEALTAAGRLPEADAELATLAALDPQNAEAWLMLGQNAVRAGESQRAIDDYLGPARLAFARLQQDRGETDAINALGLAYDLLGESDRAIPLFDEAARRREALGDPRGAAGSRRNLAFAHAVSGRHDDARRELSAASTLAAAIDDPGLRADIATDAGLLAEERGAWGEALPHYRLALNLRQAQGDSTGTAAASLNLGFALAQTGSFGDAQPLFEAANRTYEAAADRLGRVRSLHALARLDLATDRLAVAAERIETAMHLASETSLAQERAVLQFERATIARRRGDLAGALNELRDAAERFEQAGDARGQAQCRLAMAQVHLDAADADAAGRVLEVFHFESPASEEQRALLEARRGEIARLRGNHAEAARFAAAALDGAERSGSLPAQLEARALAVRLAASDGQAATARAEFANFEALLARFPAAEWQLERSIAAVWALEGEAALQAYRAALGDEVLGMHRSRTVALMEAAAAALRRRGDADDADQLAGDRQARIERLRLVVGVDAGASP